MFENKNVSAKVSVNDLILFCVYGILQNNERCTFDRLLKECFTEFPDTIKFDRYPIWPDARKLDRPLRALRRDQLILGDTKTYFLLTPAGEKRATEVAKSLRQGKLL